MLTGIDLSGKLAIVTGGYSDLGLPTTWALAKAGAHVVVPARRPELARQADRSTSRSTAPGSWRSPETRVGAGWELQFATNHLGHFALVNLSHSTPARSSPNWPATSPARK